MSTCQIKSIPGLATYRTLFLRFSCLQAGHPAMLRLLLSSDRRPLNVAAQEFNEFNTRHKSGTLYADGVHLRNMNTFAAPVVVFNRVS